MENSTLQKEDVSDIIQQGVSSYLNQNKDISIKDLLNKKTREKAGDQLKTTLKSTALDTGQNIINHLQKNEYQWEEVRRRNKPSNVRKKKRLEYALKNLKQKKDAAIAAGALKETRIMNSSSIEKSGPTIDVTATEVKDKKKGDNAQKRSSAIVKRDDKGSTLANRGTKDTEIKPPREPKPYSQKKNKFKGIKGPSKDTINKTVSKIGSAAKTGLSAFTSGYDNQDVKEGITFKHFTELAATAVATSPIWAPALKTAAVTGGAYALSKVPQIYSSIKNMMSKKEQPSFGKKIDGTPARTRSDVKGAANYKGNRKSQLGKNLSNARDAQERAVEKWRKDNGVEGTNAMPPWYGK